MIHLDTDFLIHGLVRGSAADRHLRGWLGAGEGLAMSAVAWAEFLCGHADPRVMDLVGQIVSRRVPFGEEEAALAARLFDESGRRRGSLGDCMVAASAIRARALLATASLKDFRRFVPAGLQIAGE